MSFCKLPRYTALPYSYAWLMLENVVDVGENRRLGWEMNWLALENKWLLLVWLEMGGWFWCG